MAFRHLRRVLDSVSASGANVVKLYSIPFRMIRGLAQRGPVGLVKHVWFLLVTRWNERRLQIDTAEPVERAELTENTDSVDYEPTGYTTLKRVFQQIEIDSSDVFLDFGCGKGRPLVFAAQRPFRRVIGVEMSELLVPIAESNLATNQERGLQQCGDTEVVCCSAEEFAIPSDVSVVFMFNPFRGESLQKVIVNLRESFESCSRDVTLVYVLPWKQADPFQSESWLRCVTDQRTEGLRLRIYKSSTAGS